MIAQNVSCTFALTWNNARLLTTKKKIKHMSRVTPPKRKDPTQDSDTNTSTRQIIAVLKTDLTAKKVTLEKILAALDEAIESISDSGQKASPRCSK